MAVAESDSYLKWAVSLLAGLPGEARIDIMLACSPVRPSVSQQDAALAGTAYAGRRLDVVSPKELLRRVDRDRPDGVLIACAGPSVHAYSDALSRSVHRPVLLAGIPGIAIPARRKAWGFRGAIDLLVVHSRREVAEYELVRVMTGKSGQVGLATIPFLADGPPPEAVLAADHDGDEQQEMLRARSNRVVFATQGKVPRTRRDRTEILLSLDRLAAKRPDLRVVVKTRGVPGEFHTHYEPHHYQDLWRELVAAGRVQPDAVEFASGSMAAQLDDAVALVTVSSTAVLEAMARDIPVLLIDEFGVSARLINQVFEGSGCLAGLAALEAADFRHADKSWLAENYFHPRRENNWVVLLEQLVKLAREGELPPLAAGLDANRTKARRRRDRLRLTPAGSALVRVRQRLRMRRLRRNPNTESQLGTVRNEGVISATPVGNGAPIESFSSPRRTAGGDTGTTGV